MPQSKSKRKTRSDTFPLTLHKTGQFCKEINGKLYYFRTSKQEALRRYLEQAAYLQNRYAYFSQGQHLDKDSLQPLSRPSGEQRAEIGDTKTMGWD